MASDSADLAEWRAAVAALAELERAPYDEPHTYADLYFPTDVRADNRWTSGSAYGGHRTE